MGEPERTLVMRVGRRQAGQGSAPAHWACGGQGTTSTWRAARFGELDLDWRSVEYLNLGGDIPLHRGQLQPHPHRVSAVPP